jgi:hypothetical protein
MTPQACATISQQKTTARMTVFMFLPSMVRTVSVKYYFLASRAMLGI